MADGQTDFTTLFAFQGATPTLVNGSKFDPTVDANVALVGVGLARANGLAPGSVFRLLGANVTTSGVYNASNQFANNFILLPYPTAQRLAGLPGEASAAYVRVDSVENAETVASQARIALGDGADVTSQTGTASQAVAPLESVADVALISLIVALASGALITLLTMVMIVRERRREIGVLKALGASNLKVAAQYFAEAFALVTIGGLLGLGLGALASNRIVRILAASQAPSQGGGPGFGGGGFANALGRNALQGLHATVGVGLVLDALLIVVIVAIIGGAAPAWLIARVRPAEVLRGD